MPVIKILKNDGFYALSGLILEGLWTWWSSSYCFQELCLRVDTLLGQTLPPLPISIYFSFCWKYAYIQPVPKKGDRSEPSKYRPIALLSCLSKAFETIINQWFLMHLFSFNLLSDRQCGFRNENSTGDVLAYLINSQSYSWRCCGKTFAVAWEISKAFDRVWNKSLLSKLPSYGLYEFLGSFVPSFLSGRSISAVVDGFCSKPQSVNSGVPQGSVLSPTFVLLFINDIQSITSFHFLCWWRHSALFPYLQKSPLTDWAT